MITTTPKSASDKIKARTTEQLISDFEATNDKAPSIDVAMVRGWIMAELEARNAEAFNAFIDSGQDSPRTFYEVAA